MPAKMYYDSDASLEVLEGKRIAVVGYGSQGRAHALNLRDSGLEVTVGLRKDSASWEAAQGDGLEVAGIGETCSSASIVAVLVPDQHQASVYSDAIEPNLDPRAALLFAHGFNIHFGQIRAAEETDVIMVAPKGPGLLVRRTYQEGSGTPALVAVDRDVTGDLLYEGGFTGMRRAISDTAEYGDLTRGTKVIGPETEAAMHAILDDVRSGSFALEWVLENRAGTPMLDARRRLQAKHPIEDVGARLREMMPWVRKG